MRALLPPRVTTSTEVLTPFWYGTVYVDPDVGRPLACYAWCDPDLRLKTAVPTTAQVVTDGAP